MLPSEEMETFHLGETGAINLRLCRRSLNVAWIEIRRIPVEVAIGAPPDRLPQLEKCNPE